MNSKKARRQSNPKLNILLVCHPDLKPRLKKQDGRATQYPEWKTESDVLIHLQKMGHSVRVIGIKDSFKKILQSHQKRKFDLAFNLLEEVWGSTLFEGALPAFLESLKLPYTGCSLTPLLACRKKNVASRLLQHSGVLTPKLCLIEDSDLRGYLKDDLADLPFPAIVKLAAEDASRGIDLNSVVETPAKALKVAHRLFSVFGGPVVVETFVPGREFHVTVIRNQQGYIGFPPIETVFKRQKPLQNIATEEMKWNPSARRRAGIISRIVGEANERELSEHLIQIATKACEALFVDGYARVDLRMDSLNRIYVIDVNPNPDIGRSFEFADSVRAGGFEYSEMLDLILFQAIQRDHDRKKNLKKWKRHA